MAPMLPVVAGERATKRHKLAYTAPVVAASPTLSLTRAIGPLCLAAALAPGMGFLYMAVRVPRGLGRRVFLYSYSYLSLALLFGAMVVDRLVS